MTDLADRWINEARRHEQAADGIYQKLKWEEPASMDEEQMLHLEIARVLRNCAASLRERREP